MTYGNKTLSDLSGDNLIDSRDLVSRFEELRDEREALADALKEAEQALKDAAEALQGEDEPSDPAEALTNANAAASELPEAKALETAKKELAEWDEENEEELYALQAINEEGEDFPDWSHGCTLIREDYFPEYAEELAKDIGAIGDNADWIVIDWNATADNLKADYSTITIDGTDYLCQD